MRAFDYSVVYTKTKPKKKWKRIWIDGIKTEYKICKDGSYIDTENQITYTLESMVLRNKKNILFRKAAKYGRRYLEVSYFRVYASIFVPVPDCYRYIKKTRLMVIGEDINHLSWSIHSGRTAPEFMEACNRAYEYLLDHPEVEKISNRVLAKKLGYRVDTISRVFQSATFKEILENQNHLDFMDRTRTLRKNQVDEMNIKGNDPIEISTDSDKKSKWKRVLINGIKTKVEVNKHGECRNAFTHKPIQYRHTHRLRYNIPFINIMNMSSKVFIDRMVAYIFLPFPKVYEDHGLERSKMKVYHKDGNGLNCDYTNLEWRPKNCDYSADSMIKLCQLLSDPNHINDSYETIGQLSGFSVDTVKNVFYGNIGVYISQYYDFSARRNK